MPNCVLITPQQPVSALSQTYNKEEPITNALCWPVSPSGLATELASPCLHDCILTDNTPIGLHSASPLSIFLRVPLEWYTTATFAQFADETRASIQRSFSSPFASNTRRTFCGYCGTQLSSWNERTREEADHISLTVGSLLDEDQALLTELGFLPGSESSDEDTVAPVRTTTSRSVLRSEPQSRGAPWFEEIIQNTRLGRLKQQRGGHSGGGVHVEWEVVEWTEGEDADDEGHSTPTKRKIGEIDAGDDMEMRSS